MITSVALAIDQQVFTSYASIFTQLLMLASVVKIFLFFVISLRIMQCALVYIHHLPAPIVKKRVH